MRISSIEVNQILLGKPNVTFKVREVSEWVTQADKTQVKKFVIWKAGKLYGGEVIRKYIETKEGGEFVYSHEKTKVVDLVEVQDVCVKDEKGNRIVVYRRK